MDKYEFNTRIDQIKKAMLKKNYKVATQTADMIDWARVKNNSILILVADAYEADRQYEKAKEVLLIAYKRAPMGRQLAYRLAILSVKMKDFVDAEEFYQDFTQIAPADTAAYILKYRIAKGRGEDTESLIQILEAYNEVDMDEKWAYELAKLYSEAGNIDKCVSQCDEISLWFNEGTYVTKALKLKQKYTPLTKGQAERLGIYETKTFKPVKEESDNEVKTEKQAQSEGEEQSENASDSSVPDDIKIKEFSGNGSDTIDIQETIAKSMEILLQDDESNNVNKAEEELTEAEETPSKDESEKTEEKYHTGSILNPLYKVEGDGQIMLDVDEEEKKIDKQITGQLDIEAVLKDLESRGILKPHTVASTVDAMDKAATVVEKAKEETAEYRTINRTSSLIDTIEKISAETDIEDIAEDMEDEPEPEEDIVVNVLDENGSDEDEKPEEFEIEGIDDETLEEAEITEGDEVLQEEPEQKDLYNSKEEADDSIQEATKKFNTADLENISEALEMMADATEAEVQKEAMAETEPEEAHEKDIADGELKTEKKDEEIPEIEEKNEEILKEPEEEKSEVGISGEAETENLKEETEKAEISEEDAEKTEISEETAENESEISKEVETEEKDEETDSFGFRKDAAPEKKKGFTLSIKKEDDFSDVEEDDFSDVEDEDELSDAEEETVESDAKDNSGDSDSDNGEAENNVKEVSAAATSDIKPEEENAAETSDIKSDERKITEASGTKPETENATEMSGEKTDKEEKSKKTDIKHNDSHKKLKLSPEDEEKFSSFITITGLEDHLAKTINSLTSKEDMDGTSSKNNILIMGDEKSGKTTLAIELIKTINERRGRNGRKIAKVNSTALNNRGFTNSFNKLLKCDLIVEDASALSSEIVEEIVNAGKYYTDDMIIILEDKSARLKEFLNKNSELEEMFGNILVLKEFSLKEWLTFAEDYAESKGYIIDPVGQLALAQNIDEIYGINQGVEEEDVMEIIDRAIERSSRKFGRRLANIFSGKKGDLEYDTLKEKDFI